MLLYEFRIPMPFTIAEYQVGQLYTVSEMSLRATGGGEGVEVIENSNFEDKTFRVPGYTSGFYTRKIYHMESKIPGFIRLLTDPGKFDILEEAWNAFPYCTTWLTNPGYMKDNFFIGVESLHLDNDTGQQENALSLSEEELKIRKVVNIDIGNDRFTSKSDMELDPSVFRTKSGRGPLRGLWVQEASPVMTAYKVVRTEFKWFGLQRKVEHLVQVNEHRLFTQFHRSLFCWSDQWAGMTMSDIKRREQEIENMMKDKIQQPDTGRGFNPSDVYDTKSQIVLDK